MNMFEPIKQFFGIGEEDYSDNQNVSTTVNSVNYSQPVNSFVGNSNNKYTNSSKATSVFMYANPDAVAVGRKINEKDNTVKAMMADGMEIDSDVESFDSSDSEIVETPVTRNDSVDFDIIPTSPVTTSSPATAVTEGPAKSEISEIGFKFDYVETRASLESTESKPAYTAPKTTGFASKTPAQKTKVQLLRPKVFSEAKEAVELLKKGIIVVAILSGIDKQELRIRYSDYVSGACAQGDATFKELVPTAAKDCVIIAMPNGVDFNDYIDTPAMDFTGLNFSYMDDSKK